MSDACPKCVEFDQETAGLMQALFSQDEMSLMLITMAQAVTARQQALKTFPADNPHRLMIQRDLDFAGKTLGKFLVGLEPEQKKKTVTALIKTGIRIALNHETCPHKEEPHDAPSPSLSGAV